MSKGTQVVRDFLDKRVADKVGPPDPAAEALDRGVRALQEIYALRENRGQSK